MGGFESAGKMVGVSESHAQGDFLHRHLGLQKHPRSVVDPEAHQESLGGRSSEFPEKPGKVLGCDMAITGSLRNGGDFGVVGFEVRPAPINSGVARRWSQFFLQTLRPGAEQKRFDEGASHRPAAGGGQLCAGNQLLEEIRNPPRVGEVEARQPSNSRRIEKPRGGGAGEVEKVFKMGAASRGGEPEGFPGAVAENRARPDGPLPTAEAGQPVPADDQFQRVVSE